MERKIRKNPLSWVPTVYFAMGFPFITISIISVVMLKDLGVENDKIAEYTSLLILPWSLKPIFSIVMEVWGTKRKYVIFSEIIASVMLGCIVYALPLPNFFTLVIAALGVMAISGSVHDIAGDGVYMEQLSAETQSALSGWQGAFYNMAKVLGNGGLVYLAGWLTTSQYRLSVVQSWQFIMMLGAVVMLLIAVYHWNILPKDLPRRGQNQQPESSFKEKFSSLVSIILDFFKKKNIVYYLFFIFFYRFAEGLAMKIAPLFLKDDISKGGLALSNESYGLIYGTFGTLAFICGSILAGHYISRLGLRRTLFTLAVIFNVPFAVYLLFAMTQPVEYVISFSVFGSVISLEWVVTLGIVFEYFSYGFGFVGLILFMMQQIAPGKHPMAHYAFANSLMNLSVIVPGYISGKLSDYLGYQGFFTLVMIMVIPALLITWYVPFTHRDKKEIEK